MMVPTIASNEIINHPTHVFMVYANLWSQSGGWFNIVILTFLQNQQSCVELPYHVYILNWGAHGSPHPINMKTNFWSWSILILCFLMSKKTIPPLKVKYTQEILWFTIGSVGSIHDLQPRVGGIQSIYNIKSPPKNITAILETLSYIFGGCLLSRCLSLSLYYLYIYIRISISISISIYLSIDLSIYRSIYLSTYHMTRERLLESVGNHQSIPFPYLLMAVALEHRKQNHQGNHYHILPLSISYHENTSESAL